MIGPDWESAATHDMTQTKVYTTKQPVSKFWVKKILKNPGNDITMKSGLFETGVFSFNGIGFSQNIVIFDVGISSKKPESVSNSLLVLEKELIEDIEKNWEPERCFVFL